MIRPRHESREIEYCSLCHGPTPAHKIKLSLCPTCREHLDQSRRINEAVADLRRPASGGIA